MADNVGINEAGTPTTEIAADELVDGTLGTVKSQIIKVWDATLGSSNPWVIENTGAGRVTVTSIPAATNLTDSISAVPATGAIMNGLTALTPKFAFVSAAVSSTTTVITAVASKKLRIHQAALLNSGATVTTVTFNNTGLATAPTFTNGSNGGEVLPFSPMGWFETTSGSALTVTLGAGNTANLLVGYTEV